MSGGGVGGWPLSNPYKPEYIWKLMKGRNIMTVCLDLKMSLDGTSDALSQVEESQHVEILWCYLNEWKESNHQFDFLVKELIKTTLRYYMQVRDYHNYDKYLKIQ